MWKKGVMNWKKANQGVNRELGKEDVDGGSFGGSEGDEKNMSEGRNGEGEGRKGRRD